MARCDNCGNDYDKSFTITAGGKTHTFDSFECAIYMLAPTCTHCRCRIIGHGVEASGQYFCCANCAKRSGVTGLRDRQEVTSRCNRSPRPASPLLHPRFRSVTRRSRP